MHVWGVLWWLNPLVGGAGFLDQKKDIAERLERKVAKLTPAEQDAVQCWPTHKDEGSMNT